MGGEVILLGAGASVEAGIPATKDLTDGVISAIAARKRRVDVGIDERKYQQWLAKLPEDTVGWSLERMEQVAGPRPPTHAVRAVRHIDPATLIHAAMYEQRLREGEHASEIAVDLEAIVSLADVLAERVASGLTMLVREWDPAILEIDHAGGIRTHVPITTANEVLARFVESHIENRQRHGHGGTFRDVRRRIVEELPTHLQIKP